MIHYNNYTNEIIMKTIFCKSFLLIIFLLGSITFSKAQDQKRNSILFFEVDDWVEVHVNGKMVFRKAADGGNLGDEVNFDINPHIANLKNPIVEIKLFNAQCPTCESGNGWIIEFEVYQNGESVDYIIEEGDSLGGGEVFSIEYEWGYI